MALERGSASARTLVRCDVCGFAEVHTDHVADRGWVMLAACPRCDHRWTERVAGPPRPARYARVERPAAASAA